MSLNNKEVNRGREEGVKIGTYLKLAVKEVEWVGIQMCK